MNNVIKKLIITLLASCSGTVALASDYHDGNIHKNDYRWLQLNLMQSVDAKIPYDIKNTTYLEIEFGARSGIFDIYGYVDIFDIFDRSHDDRHGGDNFFAKISPRLSLDRLFKTDLSFGPIQELYISNVNSIGDSDLLMHYFGFGADVDVPWFGTTGVNLYARYVRENYGATNEGKWDGYQFSVNWFTPFYKFHNNSSLSYQGYMDYQFGANKATGDGLHSNNSIEWFNGLYWHSDQFALGYGLKYFRNMALIQHNSNAGKTSGIGHYFSLTYKF